ncbi:hypothetical protein HDU67_007752 [Dinochytrium kinnereticum]|nr:hypothetical protein HDU67_007752 [Dinochytrium kinnereticum]
MSLCPTAASRKPSRLFKKALSGIDYSDMTNYESIKMVEVDIAASVKPGQCAFRRGISSSAVTIPIAFNGKSLKDTLRQHLDANNVSSLDLKAAVVLAPITWPNPSDLLNIPSLLSAELCPSSHAAPSIPIVGTVVSSTLASDPTSTSILVTLIHGSDVSVRAALAVPPSKRTKRKAVGRWPDLSLSTGRADVFSTSTGGFDLNHFGKDIAHSEDANFPMAELRDLPESDSDLALVFTDKDPHDFLRSLDARVPKAAKIGILGAMTPFATGIPHTLYYNGDVLSAGATALLLSFKKFKPSIKVGWPGLLNLGEKQKIMSCRGNMILSLDTGPAAKQLIKEVAAVPSAQLSEDHRLYARIDATSAVGERVYRITSGDPSSGILSIDTTRTLEVNTGITFLRPERDYEAKGENNGAGILFFTENAEQKPVSKAYEGKEKIILQAASDGIIFGMPGQSSDLTDVSLSEVVLNK